MYKQTTCRSFKYIDSVVITVGCGIGRSTTEWRFDVMRQQACQNMSVRRRPGDPLRPIAGNKLNIHRSIQWMDAQKKGLVVPALQGLLDPERAPE